MVVDALERGIGAAVIDADHRSAPHDAAIGKPLELGLGGGHPFDRRAAFDLAMLGEQAPAEPEILLAQDHPRARPGRGERRRQARSAAADDQNIAERVGLLVVIGVGDARAAAEPGGAADGRLVELLPERGRPHEGLVVEAGAEDRREQLVHREQIEFQRRKAVLARGVEPVIELDGGGAGVRLAPRARAELDQRAGLLRAGREDAARAMIFERAADQAHAVGEQRRSERVAGMAGHLLAVEGEGERARAVDQAAGRGAMGLRLRHAQAPLSANSTAVISCVVMSRVTTSQAWQPWL